MQEKEKVEEEQHSGEGRICRGPGKGTPCPACRKKMESGATMLQSSEPATDEGDKVN